MIGWIILGAAGWVVAAVVVVLWFGRMVRARDRQIPRPDAPTPTAGHTPRKAPTR